MKTNRMAGYKDKFKIVPVNTLFTDRRGRVFESRHSDLLVKHLKTLRLFKKGVKYGIYVYCDEE